MAKKKGTIPKYELEALAEVLYPTLKEFFETQQGKADFEKWQRKQQGNELKSPKDKSDS